MIVRNSTSFHSVQRAKTISKRQIIQPFAMKRFPLIAKVKS